MLVGYRGGSKGSAAPPFAVSTAPAIPALLSMAPVPRVRGCSFCFSCLNTTVSVTELFGITKVKSVVSGLPSPVAGTTVRFLIQLVLGSV